MTLKVDDGLTVHCARQGCATTRKISYARLKEEVDYNHDGLDEALRRALREEGWTGDDPVCPNHLDTGGKVASFEAGIGRNVVTLVLSDEEARAFSGKTFRVKVDP